MISLLPTLPLSAEFRQVRQYSNMAYVIASEIITRLCHTPFPDVVKSNIFEKLDMLHTTYHGHMVEEQMRVQGFIQYDVDITKARTAWINRSGNQVPEECTGTPIGYRWDVQEDQVNFAGAGGVWTTGEDMV